MHKRLIILVTVLFACAIAYTPFTVPHPAAADTNPFTQMLNVVPAAAATSKIIGYADFRAIVAARPGATPLNSMADFNAFLKSTSAGGWLALTAIGSIYPDSAGIHRDYFVPSGSSDIDPYSIQRELYYYRDLSDQLLLLNGNFDTNAIENALSTKGFTRSDLSDPTHNVMVWCSTDGCDKGDEPDPTWLDMANPFGGGLGFREPIAIGPGYAFGSRDFGVFRNQLDSIQGKGATLASVPSFAGLAEAITAQGTLIQFVGFGPISIGSFAAIQPAVLNALSQWTSIPAYKRAAFAHLVSGDKQLAVVALVYDHAADAQVAAQAIPTRLAQYPVLIRRPFTYVSMMSLLAALHGALDTPKVYAASNGQSVALFTFHAPLESSTPDAKGNYQQSGQLYSLLVTRLMKGDVGWMVITIPKYF